MCPSVIRFFRVFFVICCSFCDAYSMVRPDMVDATLSRPFGAQEYSLTLSDRIFPPSVVFLKNATARRVKSIRMAFGVSKAELAVTDCKDDSSTSPTTLLTLSWLFSQRFSTTNLFSVYCEYLARPPISCGRSENLHCRKFVHSRLGW